MITVDAIKAEYPAPRIPQNDNSFPESYCVGGAFCLFTGWQCPDRRFPDTRDLAEALQRANPDLTDDASRAFAYYITTENDRGAYEKSWAYLEQALAWSIDTQHGIRP